MRMKIVFVYGLSVAHYVRVNRVLIAARFNGIFCTIPIPMSHPYSIRSSPLLPPSIPFLLAFFFSLLPSPCIPSFLLSSANCRICPTPPLSHSCSILGKLLWRLRDYSGTVALFSKNVPQLIVTLPSCSSSYKLRLCHQNNFFKGEGIFLGRKSWEGKGKLRALLGQDCRQCLELGEQWESAARARLGGPPRPARQSVESARRSAAVTYIWWCVRCCFTAQPHFVSVIRL